MNGIWGLIISFFRRSVKYKHHYSSEISSQDNHEENISNTADPGVQIEIDNKKAAFEEAVLCDELQEVNEGNVIEKTL